MIVPSIDLSAGHAVQLIGGEIEALDAGDPIPILERFSIAGEVAVIDIDAARGEGSNRQLIADLCRRATVRVGGGIRDIESAVEWLDLGASRIIVGTAASPEFLSRLPRERVIVALDCRDGEVLSHGWRQTTDRNVLERIAELRDLCGGFLVTFVEREGLLGGTDLELAARVAAAAAGVSLTVAGGIATAEEVGALDRLGADAQVGMALYTGGMSLSDAITAPLQSDRADGLWPTVVVDEVGTALGLAWSNGESIREAVETRRGVYHSRTRGLWEKGATSGATQRLLGIDVDCDRDSLRFTVVQQNGFCHTGDRTCWGADRGLARLARRLEEIAADDIEGNTASLLADPQLLSSKIREEATELAAAVSPREVVAETADLIYFALVKAAAAGVSLDDIAAELDSRELRVTRRPMQAKGVGS